ncbi:hypothetical protein [Xylanimonas cellulosilytica]|uniref:hypothetical protein n=1 Tax=Xylanimonas cellulosilytica TaxID=186189 RepID=UPI00019C0DE3|nr:hypothetical protein [Xylanimonas cellulosilytica]
MPHFSSRLTARIVWEHDGEEWIDTRTTAYTHDAVLVIITDKRLRQRVAAWLTPTDVRRR